MNGENVPSLQGVQVLFQRNLAEKSVSTKVWGVVYFYAKLILCLFVRGQTI